MYCVKIIFVLMVLGINQINNGAFAFVDAYPDASHNPSSTSFGDAAWKVFDQDTVLPCIKLQGTIRFKVAADQHFGTESIQVPETATATGHCLSLWGDYQDIRLTWDTNSVLGTHESVNKYSYSIYFGFATSWTSEFSNLTINSNEFALNSVTVVVYGEEASQDSQLASYSISDFTEFITPKNKTFTCSTVQFQNGDLFLNISNLEVQAFNIHENYFSSFECENDKYETETEETLFPYVVQGMAWIFVGFFAFCLMGVVLVLLVGGFNKRHDLMAIGYRFVGAGEVKPSEA